VNMLKTGMFDDQICRILCLSEQKEWNSTLNTCSSQLEGSELKNSIDQHYKGYACSTLIQSSDSTCHFPADPRACQVVSSNQSSSETLIEYRCNDDNQTERNRFIVRSTSCRTSSPDWKTAAGVLAASAVPAASSWDCFPIFFTENLIGGQLKIAMGQRLENPWEGYWSGSIYWQRHFNSDQLSISSDLIDKAGWNGRWAQRVKVQILVETERTAVVACANSLYPIPLYWHFSGVSY